MRTVSVGVELRGRPYLTRLLQGDRLAHPDWQARAPDLEGFQRDLGTAGDWLAAEHARASRTVRALVMAQGPGKPGLPKVTILHGRAWLEDGGPALTRLTRYATSFLRRAAWSTHRDDVERCSVMVEDMLAEFELTLQGRAWGLETVTDDDQILAYTHFEIAVPTLDDAAQACRDATRIRYLSAAPAALRRVAHLLRHDLIQRFYQGAQSPVAR